MVRRPRAHSRLHHVIAAGLGVEGSAAAQQFAERVRRDRHVLGLEQFVPFTPLTHRVNSRLIRQAYTMTDSAGAPNAASASGAPPL